MKPIDIKLIDKRVIHKNMEQGLMSGDDYKKYLHALPDDRENSLTVDFETLFEDHLSPLSSLSSLD